MTIRYSPHSNYRRWEREQAEWRRRTQGAAGRFAKLVRRLKITPEQLAKMKAEKGTT